MIAYIPSSTVSIRRVIETLPEAGDNGDGIENYDVRVLKASVPDPLC